MTWIVGIDCATVEAKIGLALGRLDGERPRIQEATLCTRERSAVSIIVDWLKERSEPCLLAIDAPLGWPKPMAEELVDHRAGIGFTTPRDSMFRRTTDIFIAKKLKRMPLDVGAAWIARTAHSALQLLSDLREKLNAPIPLAWKPEISPGVSAIEVYPAATLVAHGIRSKGYKKRGQSDQRREIVDALCERLLRTREDVGDLCQSGDMLDAAVCVLAGADFLRGHAMSPEDRGLAEHEGWIWSAPLQCEETSMRREVR